MKKGYLLLFAIVFIGFFLRTYNINWDQNQHLHPDERFLTMVGSAISLPSSVYTYFDSTSSLLNPRNNGFEFFVYGLFPLSLVKLISVILSFDTYNGITIVGRLTSAVFDTLCIIVIFKILQLSEKRFKIHPYAKYLGSFFYALYTLPIQLSHFFAVDTLLNFFMLFSFYSALLYAAHKKSYFILLSSIFLGFALASKISAALIIPLNLFVILLPTHQNSLKINFSNQYIKKFLIKFTLLLSYLIFTYLILRIADPYFFESNNLLNPQVSNKFYQNITQLKSFEGDNTYFPPAIQWINKPPVIFSLLNFFVIGIGGSFVFFFLGIYTSLRYKGNLLFVSLVLWIFGVFVFLSSQFVQPMRYFLFLYPFTAIFSGVGAAHLLNKKWGNYLLIPLLSLFVLTSFSFISIYIYPHTRIAASNWIYENIPDKSILITEHWDDALPLAINFNADKQFENVQLPVFDPDTKEKWLTINSSLKKGDYLILSSNRGWGSIGSVPEKYPLMSAFYKDLLSDKTEYKRISEFTSYPSLKFLGLPLSFPDDWADESFSVYDHPRVIIFKKITR